jgi:uncharacterized protein YjiK
MSKTRSKSELTYLGDILDNTRLSFNADTVSVTYNGDNNPEVIIYKKQNVTVMTVNITYTGTNPTNIVYTPS